MRVLVIALFNCAAGAGAAEAYVDSVALPGAPNDPQASVLYYRDGHTILARVGTTDHSDVALSAVPLPVQRAVLSAEDRGFYSHAGVSARGVARAFVADVGGARQGASTITQQWVRNAFLTQDFSVDRKIREFALAVKVERQYTKDQILEHYLNTIYYGRGAYGIAAAAHAYFGITTDRLTPAQGAVLAAVIKDPYRYDPAVDPTAAKQRWTWIVDAEKGEKWLTGDVAYPAIAPTDPSATGPNGLVVDQVETELASHGITSQELHTRGLSVVTSLDATAQSSAVALVAQQLKTQPKGLRAALVALDPKTGGVRAYYGGDQGSGFYDYATATHPAASTFKPIVLAAAERQGIGYQSRWDGSSPRSFAGRPPLTNRNGIQCPNCTLESAMVDSLNTPFYAVTQQIGADKVRQMAVDLGIPQKYDKVESMVDHKGDPEPGKTRLDIGIGAYPVAPDDLASVYATFADGGARHDRYFVESARDATGHSVYNATVTSKIVLTAAVASDVSTVLGAVVKDDKVGRPAAGKTGTQAWGNTKDNQDAWMAGYTPDLAATVWMGKAVPGPIRDDQGRPIEGETVPSKLWKNFLQASLNGLPKTSLPKPAHVGRTDVGDAGKDHDGDSGDGTNPDSVSNLLAADPGYDPVVHTAHSGKRLALTFDDGPSEYTPQVLDLLAEYHIKATFCMVGENATWYPDTVRRIVADGHALCDHSMHHDDLGLMTPQKAGADIQNQLDAVDAAVPGATVTYYRAPYGDFGKSAKVAAGMGLTPLGWLVDPDDWTLPGVNAIVSRIEAQLTPRAVVLVHDGGGDRQQTVDALKILIPKLLSEGWTFDLPQVTQHAHALPGKSSTPSAPESSSPAPESTVTSSPPVSASPSDTATPPADGTEPTGDPGPTSDPTTPGTDAKSPG